MSTFQLASWPERHKRAGSPLLAFLMGAIIGQGMAFLLLWQFGFWIALLGAPFFGAALGVRFSGSTMSTSAR